MNSDKSINDILYDSKVLEIKISDFKSNIFKKKDFLIFEKNQFDLFIDSAFNLLEKTLIFLDKNLKIKSIFLTIIIMIKNSLQKF